MEVQVFHKNSDEKHGAIAFVNGSLSHPDFLNFHHMVCNLNRINRLNPERPVGDWYKMPFWKKAEADEEQPLFNALTGTHRDCFPCSVCFLV